MHYVIEEKSKEAIPAELLENKTAIKALSHPTRWHILELLAEEPTYPRKLAHLLNLHEQKVYYHLNILKKFGFIEEKKGESNTVKIFQTKNRAYCIIPPWLKGKIKDVPPLGFKPTPKLLEGLVVDGKINCKIVVGAPVPHGESKRMSRCTYIAGEVASVLGMYGKTEERLVYLDNEFDHWKDNLIIIEGMLVNDAQKTINEHSPIRFDKTGNSLFSELSNNDYTEPGTGFICKMKNPFDETKTILVLAGVEWAGTKAAVFAFKKYFDRIEKGNMYDSKSIAKAVFGIERKGEVVDVEFLE